MIYDGHAYCFPDLRGNGGFADRDEFQRHVQLAVAGMGHSREPWRKRDRAPADTSALADMSRGWSFDALEDANLTASRGRFEWTGGGETYVKQLMPPSIADMDYDADSLIAEMDYAGVDMAMLHRTAYLGIGNDFVANCVRQYPDRLQGLAFIEPWLVAPRSATVDSYVDELGVLRRWMEAYPDVVVVFTHGFSWRTFREGDTMNLPDELFGRSPPRARNFYMQLVLSVTLGARWPYRCRSSSRRWRRLDGAHWCGQADVGLRPPLRDAPLHLPAVLDQIRGYDNVLSAGDIAAITGGEHGPRHGPAGRTERTVMRDTARRL